MIITIEEEIAQLRRENRILRHLSGLNDRPLTPSIGMIIKCLRIQRGVGVPELSEASGISQATIYRHENGDTDPSFETLASLAKALRLKVSEMVLNYERLFDDGPSQI